MRTREESIAENDLLREKLAALDTGSARLSYCAFLTLAIATTYHATVQSNLAKLFAHADQVGGAR